MEDITNQVNNVQVMDNNDNSSSVVKKKNDDSREDEMTPAVAETTKAIMAAFTTSTQEEEIAMKQATEVLCYFISTGCTVEYTLPYIEAFVAPKKDKEDSYRYEICEPYLFLVCLQHLQLLQHIQQEARKFLLDFAKQHHPDGAVQKGEFENMCLLQQPLCTLPSLLSFSHYYMYCCSISHSQKSCGLPSQIPRYDGRIPS